MGNGWRDSLHGGWAYRLSLRHQQGRREDSTPFRRRDRRRADRNWNYAAIAIPRDRLDELLGLPSISYSLPHRSHHIAKCGSLMNWLGQACSHSSCLVTIRS